MATRIAWWLNLDAELELAEPARYRRHPELASRLRTLSSRLSSLLLPGDVVLDGSLSASALGMTTALAFCPTPSAQQVLGALGFRLPPSPALSVLRTVARRSFATHIGQTLPGARYVWNLDELEATVREPSFSGEWLLKRDFSFAGRERRRVRGAQLDTSTLGFARRSFARAQGLQVEPYVERESDYAQHGYLLKSGELLVGPASLQHCDARGVWQESAALPAGALSKAEAEALTGSVVAAGAALREAGYFGAFGVDGFRYRRGERLAFQPRSEVNARFTMGFPRELLERALALADAG
jgi:hypothetical protein